jgi:hypothetical protein
MPSSSTEEATRGVSEQQSRRPHVLHSHTTDATPRAAGLLCVRPITNSGARYYNQFSAVIILYVSNSEVLAVLIRRCTRGRSRQSSVVVSCASATTTPHKPLVQQLGWLHTRTLPYRLGIAHFIYQRAGWHQKSFNKTVGMTSEAIFGLLERQRLKW